MMELPGQKKKFDDIISRLDTMHESDGQPTGRQTVRQTDRQTDRHCMGYSKDRALLGKN